MHTYRTRQIFAGYLFVLPAALLTLVFVFVPFVIGFINSLHSGFLTNLQFVGLQNYLELFTSSRFWRSLYVTVVFTLTYTGVSLAIAFFAANWFVMQGVRFKPLFSSLIVLPFIITPAVATLVWQYMFDFRFGILNRLLTLIGLPALPWLREPGLALLALVIVQVWFTVG